MRHDTTVCNRQRDVSAGSITACMHRRVQVGHGELAVSRTRAVTATARARARARAEDPAAPLRLPRDGAGHRRRRTLYSAEACLLTRSLVASAVDDLRLVQVAPALSPLGA
jgi:hypothetical protein